MPSSCKSVICFDLDDTLYKEIDFVSSAYREIASWCGHPEFSNQMMEWFHQGKNVFMELNHALGLSIEMADYLRVYRNHYPSISLDEDVRQTLDCISTEGVVLGLITDGRSMSQRNKIKALGLEKWFEDSNIVISEEFGSEKTDIRNFMYFMEKYPSTDYCYVGDNPQKDFMVPNQLGWKTIMLKDDGRNIHRFSLEETVSMPQIIISGFIELISCYDN